MISQKKYLDAASDHTNESCELVCLDLRMPEMGGKEAIRKIRDQETIAGVLKRVKIIVTTIHTDTVSITTALTGRCDTYWVKPIDIAKLKEELRTLGPIQ
jgi:two-component system, chemotaxis family, chemotaxis protein CheY